MRIEWLASSYADPLKPAFVVTFKNVGSPRETWETDAKQLAAMIIDGQRHELKPYQAVVTEGTDSVGMVLFKGPRSILAAIVAATKAGIEFGDKRYDLGERGSANCRELLRQSRPMAKAMR